MNFYQPIIKPWTEAEIETALNMRSRGYSGSQIGKAIGKTRSAVLGMIRRMRTKDGDNKQTAKLTTSAGRPKGDGQPKSMKRAKARPNALLTVRDFLYATHELPEDRGYSANAEKLVTITHLIPLEDIPSQNIPLEQLNAFHCRYITEGEGADALYCGCMVKPGKSWCSGHYSRVFRKASAEELA